MQRVLVVVDMQNDFITGALGTPEAISILPRAVDKVKGWQGPVLYTRDTHSEQYLDTQEGRLLPVVHCVKGSWGWQIHPELEALRESEPLDKPGFGALALADMLREMDSRETVESVTVIGLCTDVCVISDALIVKAALPQAAVYLDAACCAGITPRGHAVALEAMKACQILIQNETPDKA